MKAQTALKFFAGVTIMFSTFLLLLNISNYKIFARDIKYALSPKEFSVETSLLQQTARVTPPQNIIEGFFDVEREGDLQDELDQNGQQVIKHYRAIQSDMLKQPDKNPTLKLQVYDNQLKKWVTTEITKIDRDDGAVYFLLKTENEDDIEPHDYYTGTYQLIFD